MKYLYCLLSVVLLAACGGNNGGEKMVPVSEVLQQRDSLVAIIDQQAADFNAIMEAYTEVQDGLRQISEAEGRVTLAEGDLERGNNRAAVQENMSYIREELANKQRQIDDLKARLSSSRLNVEQMQHAIANLQQQIDDQQRTIQQLEIRLAQQGVVIAQQTDSINALGETISELEEQNVRKDETVAAQDRALNEAYYVYGTKSELKNQKILDGSEVLTRGDFNKSYFTKIDIRVDKQIKLYSKSATIKTSHPQGSYTLTKDKSGYYVLNITKPNEFWSTSRYLVVLVK